MARDGEQPPASLIRRGGGASSGSQGALANGVMSTHCAGQVITVMLVRAISRLDDNLSAVIVFSSCSDA